MAECIKMPLGTEVGLGPGDIVLHGDTALPKSAQLPPIFGPTARWIKMPLGMEVGLIPGDFMLDGDPAPSPKGGGASSQFWPMSIAAKRLDGSRCHLVRTSALAYATLC